jgi:hypothetical protein
VSPPGESGHTEAEEIFLTRVNRGQGVAVSNTAGELEAGSTHDPDG